MAAPKTGPTAPHVPTEKTRSEVELLTSFGNTQAQISNYLDIDESTLRIHYRRELDTAVLKSNSQVAKRLFHKAVVQDDLSAQIFWLKTRGRWRERDSEEDPTEVLLEEIRELRKQLLEKNKREY